MSNLQNITAKITVALLAIIQVLSGLQIGLPAWADAQGVNLLSAAILAVGLVVQHVANKPTDPAA